MVGRQWRSVRPSLPQIVPAEIDAARREPLTGSVPALSGFPAIRHSNTMPASRRKTASAVALSGTTIGTHTQSACDSSITAPHPSTTQTLKIHVRHHNSRPTTFDCRNPVASTNRTISPMRRQLTKKRSACSTVIRALPPRGPNISHLRHLVVSFPIVTCPTQNGLYYTLNTG